MKKLSQCFILAFTLCLSFHTLAQGHYNISGSISDENGVPLKRATVFISNTEKITMTNDSGKFVFVNIIPGAYHISTTMVGFESYFQDLSVQDKSVLINVYLKEKPIQVQEVIIKSSNWKTYLDVFKGQFLGTSTNGNSSRILNPDVLDFYFDKKIGVLSCHADKLIMIENKALGYKIQYLLRNFEYNIFTNTAIYDGEASFEELDGSQAEEKQWVKNRTETYKGSLMHFLRSVYKRNTLGEGFITNIVYKKQRKSNNDRDIIADAHLADLNTLVTNIDSTYLALKFKSIYLIYDPRKAKKLKNEGTTMTSQIKNVPWTDKASILNISLDEAIIDKKGAYTDYRAFFMEGHLAHSRVADQLPFEYQQSDIIQGK